MSDTDDLMKQVRELQKFKAPPGLQEKLLAIPQQHLRSASFTQRYARIALLGLAAAAAILFYTHLPKKDAEPLEHSYSREEIATARQEVALAFHYVNDVSLEAGKSVNHLVVDSSTQAIYKGVFYPLIEGQPMQHTDSGEQP